MLRFKSLKDKYSFLDFIHRKKEYVFLDLEFNCFTDDGSFHEITSIGAIKCDKEFNSINCFHSFVTPISYEKNKDNQIYNDFYKLNFNKRAPRDGSSFKKVIEDFYIWLGETDCEIFVWGTQDTPVLLANLEASNLQDKYSFLINRIRNIQPEVSGSIKVLGNPINYSISLENMKKLFNLEKEVAHNGLLDSIDLMNVFKKYKTNPVINQNILCELSYTYRNVDINCQFNNFKKNFKNKKTNRDIKSRALINNPSLNILNNVIKTLDLCNFKFSNEHPKFTIDKNNNQLLIDKPHIEENNLIFNTINSPCVFKIKDNNIDIILKDEFNSEHLEIETNDLNPKIIDKLKKDIVLSSCIYKNIEIFKYNKDDISFINHFLNNVSMKFSNNIENITIKEDELHVRRRKDDNGLIALKFNCILYIKNEKNNYTLSISYKPLNNKIVSQIHFTVPKTDDTEKIIEEIISNSNIDRFNQPKLTDVTPVSKKIIVNLAKNNALRTKRKSQLFINENKLSFLNGRHMDYINLDNASFFITNKNRPTIIFKNMQNNKNFEIRIAKNKHTTRMINELFKIYFKNKPQITRISDISPETSNKLNALKRLPEFINANKFTYAINNNYVKIRRNIINESQMEVYKLNDFNTTINIDTHSNVSLHFTNKKDKKKILATCNNSKILSTKDIHTYMDYAVKNNDDNVFAITYISDELFKLLSICRNNNLIRYNKNYSDLDIKHNSFCFKNRKIINNFIDINNSSVEVAISSNFIFIKIFDDKQLLHYSINNSESNQNVVNNLFKLIKKQKSNSWIKVLEINKNIRNSIWRVIENSNINNASILFDCNYMQAEEKRYLYNNTPLSVKKVNSKKILLQFGNTDSTTYNLDINDKNKIFVDDLIDNSLFYEK